MSCRPRPARLACLALLVLARAATSQNYTTYLEKTIADAPTTDSASFTIPAGQCSGYIDQELLCGAWRALAVRLRVRDAAFATLHIHDALRSATVTRGRCAGAAAVQLRVACAGLSRRRRDAPSSLLPLPLPRRAPQLPDNAPPVEEARQCPDCPPPPEEARQCPDCPPEEVRQCPDCPPEEVRQCPDCPPEEVRQCPDCPPEEVRQCPDCPPEEVRQCPDCPPEEVRQCPDCPPEEVRQCPDCPPPPEESRQCPGCGTPPPP